MLLSQPIVKACISCIWGLHIVPFASHTERDQDQCNRTMAANKTMPTITPINMEKFMHVNPDLVDNELAVGSLIIVPEGMIDR